MKRKRKIKLNRCEFCISPHSCYVCKKNTDAAGKQAAQRRKENQKKYELLIKKLGKE